MVSYIMDKNKIKHINIVSPSYYNNFWNFHKFLYIRNDINILNYNIINETTHDKKINFIECLLIFYKLLLNDDQYE